MTQPATENSTPSPHSQRTVITLTSDGHENPATELDTNSTPNAPNYSSVQQTPADETPQVPESAVLVVCHSSEEHISPDILTVSSQTPVPQLLGDLIEKGIARKFYLSIIIERHIRVEALLDTGANITLMSTELLEEVQERTKRTNRTLRLQRCELNLQAYSHTGLQLKHVAPIHLKVGSMDLVHPVYVSPLKTCPLLIGKDLLNRFEPLIDFKHLKMWTQVRKPLPCQALDSNESQCQVTDTTLIDDAVAKPGSGPSTNSKDKDPLLCSLQEPESNAGPLRIMTAIDVQGTSVSDTALALWAENSAISLKLFKTLKQRHQCLTLEATPLMEVSSRAVYVLFNNCTAQDIHVPKANHLGWLISQAFHDFELMVPVIGPIPTQLMSDEYDDTVTFTKPHEIIAITSILPVSRESVCWSELTDDTHLAVYAVST